MSVFSSQNKSLLWQLLSDHPNQKNNPKKFQHVLEYRVTEMNKNRFKFNNDLMMMNKEIIKQFTQEIPKQQSEPPKKTPMTKGQVFEQNLKVQQNNFNTLINKQKPADIDFSDKTDDSPIDVRMVDTTLQEREHELKKIMAQYNPNENSAKQWLTGESTSTHLKIDDSSNIKIEPTILTNERRVRFEADSATAPVNAMSFLQKLKKTDDGILPYLKRIEENQSVIIDLLKQKLN
jgi:hypothetical protein|tara:strand:+ start:1756 stop:2457 length:702 start_codon:yes stop_codon:yes gene_type:complete